MAEPGRARGTFGPVVLLGLAAGALAAVAGAKPWVSGRSAGIDTTAEGSSMSSVLNIDSASESPLAAALALVVLACWGVLLVTRGRFRRVIAGVALVAAVGLLVTAIEARWSLPTKLSDALTRATGADTATTGFTGWYVAALVAAVLCVVAAGAAVRLVPSWPEMGTRYDAPTGPRHGEPADASAGGSGEVPADNIDIWKALDEGRDPTA